MVSAFLKLPTRTAAIPPNSFTNVIWQDIATWISKKPNQLPSGADKRAQEILTKLTLDPSDALD